MWLRNSILSLFFFQLAEHSQAKEVVYNFNVRYFNGAPDGVTKSILGVNGQFPGPTIRATIGDILTVHVTNSIQSGEGLSIHWHGLEQYFSPFYDGPEMVTQCPIVANTTMTYQFILQQSGTYWWHSHHAYQYTEGCWGLLIIDNKVEVHRRSYDGELAIALNDWYHIPGKILAEWHLSSTSAGAPPVPNSAMINGVGRYDCAIAKLQNHTCSDSIQRYPVFEVVRGRSYRIRVVNTAAHATFNFSIDGHKLQAIETDGVDTVKVAGVDKGVIAPAQRYSFIVDMDQSESGSGSTQFWIRAVVTAKFDFQNNINEYPQAFRKEVLGILRYKEPGDGDLLVEGDGDPPVEGNRLRPGSMSTFDLEMATEGRPAQHSGIPPEIEIGPNRKRRQIDELIASTGQFDQVIKYEWLNSPNLPTTNPPSSPTVLNENSCQPFFNSSRLAPPSADQKITLNVDFATNSRGEVRGSFNNIVYKVGVKPALYQVLNKKAIPRSNNPINTKYGPGKVVQLIINSRDVRTHPFHLHGHTFWIVGSGKPGDGDFNPARDNSKLTRAVVRRDTAIVPSQSWAVFRYYADNPGVWLFHCHINWHFQAGLGLLFVEGGPASVYRTFGTRSNEEGLEVCRKAGITFQ